MIITLLITLLAVLPNVAAPAQSSNPSGTPHVKVTTSDNGEKRTYVATVLDAENQIITNATLDLSAMTDNPDVRIGTAPMTAVTETPGRFERTLQYPASGDWVLVIRVHDPLSFVQLLTERVDSVGLPKASAHIDTPSRQHLRQLAPDFSQRYDPMHGIGSTDPQPLLAAQTAAVAATHRHDNDASGSPTGSANQRGWPWVWALTATAIAALAIRHATVRHRPLRLRFLQGKD
jgi:hypothetical protein